MPKKKMATLRDWNQDRHTVEGYDAGSTLFVSRSLPRSPDARSPGLPWRVSNRGTGLSIGHVPSRAAAFRVALIVDGTCLRSETDALGSDGPKAARAYDAAAVRAAFAAEKGTY